jgi:hypothetical protein
VRPRATHDEIRTAYRRQARRYHPDSGTNPSAANMAAVNEAWKVLGDPARRANYDASLAAVARSAAVPTMRSAPPMVDEPPEPPPGRAERWALGLPWVLILGVLSLIIVVTAYATHDRSSSPSSTSRPPARSTVDGVITVSSCVVLDARARAVEVTCGGPHLGVVQAVVDAALPCPLATEGYYDTTGAKLVCVTRS